MKRHLITFCAAFLASSALASSPAQLLFNHVTQLLTTQYGGLSAVDRTSLVREHQAALDTSCARLADRCPETAAFPVIERALAALADRHSYLARSETFVEFTARAEGTSHLQYGLTLRDLPGGDEVVTDVQPGSAAAKAGLRRGDRLQRGADGRPPSDVLARARAQAKAATLTVRRGDRATSVTVKAAASTTRDLPRLHVTGDVAVLRIPTFLAGGGVAQTVHDLVRRAQNAGARAMLVDLRDNEGGDLRECDIAASAFVPVFTRVAHAPAARVTMTVARGAYRTGSSGPTTQVVRTPALWSGPLAVLVNANSASCSEFFATEIRNAARGVILGEATAGLGNTSTRVFPLAGNAALQLTAVHYARLDGTPYPERIMPDVPVKDDLELLTLGRDALLLRGLDALRTAPLRAGP